MNNLKSIILVLALIIASIAVDAQCRTFARSSCETQLEDYLVSGRVYGGYMVQGQEVVINVVLNGGQKYRLINCNKPALGKVWVQLLDNKGKIVFDNAEHDFVQTWDFVVQSTQEFKVKTYIQLPENKSSEKIRDCSMVIIGSKSSS